MSDSVNQGTIFVIKELRSCVGTVSCVSRNMQGAKCRRTFHLMGACISRLITWTSNVVSKQIWCYDAKWDKWAP